MGSRSVRLSDQEEAFVARYGAPFSSQLREDLQTLEALLSAGQSEIVGLFSESEVCLMCDALDMDHSVDPSKLGVASQWLYVEVSGGIKLKQLDDKWKVDAGELLGKIENLSELGAIAVFHSARRFWKHPEFNDLSNERIIEQTWPPVILTS